MPGLFNSYIYDQDKRKAMSQTPMFASIESLIEKEHILNSNETGDCNFILRKQFEEKELPTWLQWENAYFSSGKHRLELIKKAGGRTTYQLLEYYGRTQEELFSLSKNTFGFISKKIKMTPQAWLNIIYIKLIDKPYEDFLRIIESGKNLNNLFNGVYEFDLSDPITAKEQAIDFFMYSSETKELEGGIKILPDEEKAKLLEPEYEEIRLQMEEKHNLFIQTYDVKTHFIFARSNGIITVRPNI